MRWENGLLDNSKNIIMLKIEKRYLSNGQYLTQEHKKVALFLHHTISTNANSPWRWWNSTPQRVGTAYIVGRDGVVTECFNPKMWAWHLGIRGDDNYMEKHSIGIELVAAGPIKYIDNEYRFYPLWPNMRHFTVIPEDEVYHLDKPWVGEEYWHTYTDKQIEATIALVKKLVKENKGIKIQGDLEGFYEYDSTVVAEHKPGIWAHSTVRRDKSDIFPYPPFLKAISKLVKGVKKAAPSRPQ